MFSLVINGVQRVSDINIINTCHTGS